MDIDYKAALLEIINAPDQYVNLNDNEGVTLDGYFSGPALQVALTQLLAEGLVGDLFWDRFEKSAG